MLQLVADRIPETLVSVFFGRAMENKAFLHFLLNFCHIWWFLKVEWAKPKGAVLWCWKNGKKLRKALINVPLPKSHYSAHSENLKIRFRVHTRPIIMMLLLRPTNFESLSENTLEIPGIGEKMRLTKLYTVSSLGPWLSEQIRSYV